MSASLGFPAFDSPISSFHLASSTATSNTLISITLDHSIYVWTVSALDDTIELISQGRLGDSTNSIVSISPLPTSVISGKIVNGTKSAGIRLVAMDENGKIAFWTLEDAAKDSSESTTIPKSLENGNGVSHGWREEMSVRTGRKGVKILQSNADFVTAIGKWTVRLVWIQTAHNIAP